MLGSYVGNVALDILRSRFVRVLQQDTTLAFPLTRVTPNASRLLSEVDKHRHRVEAHHVVL